MEIYFLVSGDKAGQGEKIRRQEYRIMMSIITLLRTNNDEKNPLFPAGFALCNTTSYF
jgi:hypothetical protein